MRALSIASRVTVVAFAVVNASSNAGAQQSDAVDERMPASARTWSFQVSLDDEPIGSHTFTLQPQGDIRRMTIDARFDVKVLFINAYRYRHQATELWRDDCLTEIDAQTDDDGKRSTVKAAIDSGQLVVTSPRGRQSLGPCVMSFAYWNPAMLRRKQLLNAQTGQHQDVTITTLPEQTVTVRNSPVRASHYRLTGTDHPIDLWYSAAGDWLALQTVVAGSKTLRYSLQ